MEEAFVDLILHEISTCYGYCQRILQHGLSGLVGIGERCSKIVEVTLAVCGISLTPIDADFDALRLKVIEIPQSALQLIVSGPCEISLDPNMPAPHPAQGVM